jgi:hypothetical protein
LDILAEPAKVGEGVVNAFVQTEATVEVVSECLLEQAEHAMSSWDGDCHGSQFPKDLVPLFNCDAFLVRENRV